MFATARLPNAGTGKITESSHRRQIVKRIQCRHPWVDLFIVLALMSSSQATFGSEIVFPQFADGTHEQVRYVTSIALTNSDESAVVTMLRFRSWDGQPYEVELYDSPSSELFDWGSEIEAVIPALQTIFLETKGDGPLNSGWVSVEYPDGLAVGGVLTFFGFRCRNAGTPDHGGGGFEPACNLFFHGGLT